MEANRITDNGPRGVFAVAGHDNLEAYAQGRMFQVSKDELAAAREWLEDCGADCEDRNPREILREVNRQYDGGLSAFLIEHREEQRALRSMGRLGMFDRATRPEVRLA